MPRRKTNNGLLTAFRGGPEQGGHAGQTHPISLGGKGLYRAFSPPWAWGFLQGTVGATWYVAGPSALPCGWRAEGPATYKPTASPWAKGPNGVGGLKARHRRDSPL